MNIIEIKDFEAKELDIYARLSEGQLLNRAKPDKGIFIAESPKVIDSVLAVRQSDSWPTCAKPIEIRSSDFDELELASFDPELEPPADSPDDPHAVSENTIAAVSVATKAFFILIDCSSFILIVFFNDLFYISYISQH